MRAVVGGAVALWLGAMPAAAATLNVGFDHATDQGAILGTLGIGVNRVTGTNSGVCVPYAGADQTNCYVSSTAAAAFALAVPDFGRVVAITTSARNIAWDSPFGLGPVGAGMNASSVDPVGWLVLDSHFEPGETRTLIDQPGLALLSLSVGPAQLKFIGTFSHDWAFDVEIAPIPLPAGLALMLSAIAAAGMVRLSARARPGGGQAAEALPAPPLARL